MDWIEPGLAIGNLEDAMAHETLCAQGVCSVLTVSAFPTHPRSALDWRFVPLVDGGGNSADQFAAAVQHVADLHRNNPGLLVHCAEGKSRSVVIVALYLAKTRRWNPEQALSYVSARRVQALPDPILWDQAKAFHDIRDAGTGREPGH